MPFRSFLPLALALSAGAASAQSVYQEQILYPNAVGGSSQPHAAPVTVDVSTAVDGRLAPGSAVVTFASDPAPYVRVDARSSGGANAILNAQLRYEFAYTGPALSYVPIDFRGLFDIQNSTTFNRSSVALILAAYAPDLRRYQSVAFELDCSNTCRYFNGPTATSLSSILVPFSGTAHAFGLDGSSATGSFGGVLMGGTDASGHGIGTITIQAFASAAIGSGVPSWAFINPSLTIDASYLAAHPEAGLTLPPGVGNAITAVPEPQAGALMLAGLLGLGALARRRRAA